MSVIYSKENKELEELCSFVKQEIKEHKYLEAELEVKNAMCKYPHSPIPHNLLGILLNIQNDKILAMKHFRAAYSLDPTYRPSRYNLESYGSLNSVHHLAYDDNDYFKAEDGSSNIVITIDDCGIKHAIRNTL